MVALILLFGILTFLTGSVILAQPERICGFLRDRLDRLLLHVLNVVVRIVFGCSLLLQSSQSKFPVLTDIIGWSCIAIALILTCMGRKRFMRTLSWAVALIETHNRIAGFLIMIFGAFLCYSFSNS